MSLNPALYLYGVTCSCSCFGLDGRVDFIIGKSDLYGRMEDMDASTTDQLEVLVFRSSVGYNAALTGLYYPRSNNLNLRVFVQGDFNGDGLTDFMIGKTDGGDINHGFIRDQDTSDPDIDVEVYLTDREKGGFDKIDIGIPFQELYISETYHFQLEPKVHSKGSRTRPIPSRPGPRWIRPY